MILFNIKHCLKRQRDEIIRETRRTEVKHHWRWRVRSNFEICINTYCQSRERLSIDSSKSIWRHLHNCFAYRKLNNTYTRARSCNVLLHFVEYKGTREELNRRIDSITRLLNVTLPNILWVLNRRPFALPAILYANVDLVTILPKREKGDNNVRESRRNFRALK